MFLLNCFCRINAHVPQFKLTIRWLVSVISGFWLDRQTSNILSSHNPLQEPPPTRPLRLGALLLRHARAVRHRHAALLRGTLSTLLGRPLRRRLRRHVAGDPRRNRTVLVSPPRLPRALRIHGWTLRHLACPSGPWPPTNRGGTTARRPT